MRDTANKTLFSGTGLMILAALLIVVITLSNRLLSGQQLDLTENHLYTLSEGTRALLKRIEEPIHLYFFYSQETAQGIPQISNYAQRIQELLQEMVETADGKIKLSLIHPEPFSPEEDRAVQLGVEGIVLGNAGDKLYFGLAGTNAVGNTEAIGFFQLNREELLEYDVAKLIYQLSQLQKPVVGLMSTLPVQGGFDVRRMQANTAWTAIEQLRQLFDVRNLETDLKEIPKDIQLLILVHPADLKPATLYAIDQFVLAGGKALVFIDPYAQAAQAGMGTDSATPQQSNPSELLMAWGIRMRADQVLGDAQYALRVSNDPTEPPFYHYAMLGIPAAGMNPKDVITQGLENVNVAFAGILEPLQGAKTEFIPLLHSSNRAMPLSALQAQTAAMDPVSLQSGFNPSGETYVLAARIHGKASSAFPNGAPTSETAEAKANDPEKTSSTKSEPPPFMAESKEPINVVVVADTDLLRDQLWVQVQNFLGQRIATPLADNGNFLINAVDNLLGSNELISIRSRAGYTRPFDRVEALQREADSRFRAKEEELKTRLSETERKLNELQSRKGEGNTLILSPEQQQALLRFQQEQLKIRQELREVRHQLDKDIDRLGAVLKFINIVLVPLLLVITVIAIGLLRRQRSVNGKMAGGQQA